LPEVSVIMPVYNNEAFLENAITSVLQQTYKDFEFIIVNDGSQDRSWSIINKFSAYDSRIVPVHHSQNKGAAAARNTAIRRSVGRYIMMADADDVQHPDRLRQTLELLKREKADMVFHDCELINENGGGLGQTKGYPEDMNTENVLLHQLRRNYLLSSLALVRRTPDVYFDESLPNAEDFELFLRLLLKGYRCVIHRKVLTKYRRHNANISNHVALSDQVVRAVLQKLNAEELHQSLIAAHGRIEADKAMAAMYLWREEPERAKKLLEELPFSAEVGFYLAVSYYKQRDYIRSLHLFEKLNQIQPDAAVHNNIGVLTYITKGDKAAAMKWFISAANLRPGYLDASYNAEAIGREEPSLRVTERPLRTQFLETRNYILS